MKQYLSASIFLATSLCFVSCSQTTPPVQQFGTVVGSQIGSGSTQYIQPVPTSGLRN